MTDYAQNTIVTGMALNDRRYSLNLPETSTSWYDKWTISILLYIVFLRGKFAFLSFILLVSQASGRRSKIVCVASVCHSTSLTEALLVTRSIYICRRSSIAL